jgi:diadenylate cyclase
MGLAERCDALVIVASEERGDVTLMHDASFERVPSAEALLASLRALMPRSVRSSRRQIFTRRELGLLATAAAIALAVWASVLYTGSAVRIRTVPIEFTNLPPGLRIVAQSAPAVEVRLRGSSWSLDSAVSADLVMRVSLARLGEGSHTVPLSSLLLQVPPGVVRR